MKIAVCVKAVPASEANIKVAGDQGNIDLNGTKFAASPLEELPFEEAMALN